MLAFTSISIYLNGCYFKAGHMDFEPIEVSKHVETI